MTQATLAQFQHAVQAANAAADGPSTDAELDALKLAVELACELLGVDYAQMGDAQEEEVS